MGDATADLLLPRIAGRRWQVALDTARPPPEDIVPPSMQRPHSSESYSAGARSVVVLEAPP